MNKSPCFFSVAHIKLGSEEKLPTLWIQFFQIQINDVCFSCFHGNLRETYGKPMVNSPLIRPAIFWGGVALGGPLRFPWCLLHCVPIGRKNTTYILFIVLAFWWIICYRSHLLREPETTIENWHFYCHKQRKNANLLHNLPVLDLLGIPVLWIFSASSEILSMRMSAQKPQSPWILVAKNFPYYILAPNGTGAFVYSNFLHCSVKFHMVFKCIDYSVSIRSIKIPLRELTITSHIPPFMGQKPEKSWTQTKYR